MPPALPPPAPPARRPVAARDLWGVAAVALALMLAWRLANVLMVAFAGALLALALLQLARPLQQRLGLSARWALVAVVVALVLALGLGSWAMGASAAEQLQLLRETLPRALQALQRWLGERAAGRWLLDLWAQAASEPQDWQRVAGLATGTLNATAGAVGALALVLAIGVYAAGDPETYRRGLLRLVPPRRRAFASQALDAVTRDLSRWLLGQGVSMLAVALVTTAGLTAIGMPLAVSLGVIAGLLDFVPYIGPIVSGVLIVAVALTEGEGMAIAAALVCLGVQQAEAYLLQPLVQRWAVRLPPVLGLLAVLVFGLLFGLSGVLLGVPLMVLSMTLVNQVVEHAWPPADARGP